MDNLNHFPFLERAQGISHENYTSALQMLLTLLHSLIRDVICLNELAAGSIILEIAFLSLSDVSQQCY